MNEYKKLKEEFNKKVAKLRENCPHKELTEWMQYYWAPGHSTGESVKLCKRCDAIVESTKVKP